MKRRRTKKAAGKTPAAAEVKDRPPDELSDRCATCGHIGLWDPIVRAYFCFNSKCPEGWFVVY